MATDYSGYFEILQQISVTNPNGGAWVQNTQYTIQWTNTNYPLYTYANIELWKGSVKQYNIATGITNDGTWNWTVPSGQTVGTDYRIKVIERKLSSSDFGTSDFSSYFSISSAALPPMEFFYNEVIRIHDAVITQIINLPVTAFIYNEVIRIHDNVVTQKIDMPYFDYSEVVKIHDNIIRQVIDMPYFEYDEVVKIHDDFDFQVIDMPYFEYDEVVKIHDDFVFIIDAVPNLFIYDEVVKIHDDFDFLFEDIPNLYLFDEVINIFDDFEMVITSDLFFELDNLRSKMNIYDEINLTHDTYIGNEEHLELQDYLDLILVNPDKKGIQFFKEGNPYRVDFNKCRLLKLEEPEYPKQLTNFTNTSKSKIIEIGNVEKIYKITINHNNKELQSDLLNFFKHDSVRYNKENFWFIKENHTDFEEVRLWQSEGLVIPQIKGGLYNVNLTLFGVNHGN